MADSGSVGLVAGTSDSTPLHFHVAIGPDAYLQLDDVVTTDRTIPSRGVVRTAGVVTQVTARHEGASFGSDVFLISDGMLPAHVQELAEITTTRVEPECYVPPLPGTAVRRATGPERDHALYFDAMQNKMVVGLGRDGEAIYVNLDFLDGTRGAHVSISGISGVATKTSFALFMLHSLFASDAVLFSAPFTADTAAPPISETASVQVGASSTMPVSSAISPAIPTTGTAQEMPSKVVSTPEGSSAADTGAVVTSTAHTAKQTKRDRLKAAASPLTTMWSTPHRRSRARRGFPRCSHRRP